MANTKSSDLESKLNNIFSKSLPALPESGKKALVQLAPILSLIGGVLTLLSAWSLWHWARFADRLVGEAYRICNAYAGYTGQACANNVSRLTMWVWLDLAFLTATGLFYLFAYSGLKERKKHGWNYLYYAVLLNVASAVASLFTDYSGGSHLFGGLVGSAIGLYVLFQIRPFYLGKAAAKKSRKK